MSLPQTIYQDTTTVQASQRAGGSRLRELDLSMVAVPAWQPDVAIAASGLIRPTNANENEDGTNGAGVDHSTGYWYKNGLTAGQTGALEPAWPTTGTVQDGSCTWTPTAPPATGGDTVSSCAWVVSGPDGALTVTGTTTTQLTASGYFNGGTSGATYTVTATVTMASGSVFVVEFIVTVI
jgi:hypothetical protein